MVPYLIVREFMALIQNAVRRSLLRPFIHHFGIAKILPHSDRKKPSPRAIRAQVARPQGTRAEALEQGLLRQPKIESPPRYTSAPH